MIIVQTTADSGKGSLRAAIANATAGEVIRFASKLKGKTITLTSGQLAIDKNLTIDGAAAAGIKISGNKASRVFLIGSDINVSLKNLTILNGKLTGSDETTGAGAGIQTSNNTVLTITKCRINNNVAGFGGGLYTGFRSTTTVIDSSFKGNDGTLALSERGGGAIATKSGGTLTIRGCSFIGNQGTNGGAINNLLTKLRVENSVFRDNDSTAGGTQAISTSGYGGAIYVDGANASGANSEPGAIGGTITIRGSRFDGNRGAGQGGGLFLFLYGTDKAIIENSAITNNVVEKSALGDALGGGLRHGNGELLIRNTTFAKNRAWQQGGGLWLGEAAFATISNSTFSQNQADDGQGNGLGGAITFANTSSSPNQLINTTIADNSAGFMGGAFWSGDQPVTLTNSIVAFNTGDNPWNLNEQTNRQFTDGGGNIEFPAPQTTSAQDVKVVAGSRVIDPKLGTLQNHGGWGQTYALLTGSPALNKADAPEAPDSDQRGLSRDSKPDVGAFEYLTGTAVFNGSSDTDVLVGTTTKDTLVGAAGNDCLLGRAGADRLTGGSGGDYFIYAGTSQKAALSGSLVTTLDQITDFNANVGDRFFLDVNDDWISDRPDGLFNAGVVSGTSLTQAAQAAYADKNQKTNGNQTLAANEAVFFTWQDKTYLAVNNAAVAFTATRDLVVDVTTMTFYGTNANAGVLAIANYFV